MTGAGFDKGLGEFYDYNSFSNGDGSVLLGMGLIASATGLGLVIAGMVKSGRAKNLKELHLVAILPYSPSAFTQAKA